MCWHDSSLTNDSTLRTEWSPKLGIEFQENCVVQMACTYVPVVISIANYYEVVFSMLAPKEIKAPHD